MALLAIFPASMTNHPNRSRAGGPARNPAPEDVRAVREMMQTRRACGIIAAQDWCAEALHTSRRAFQQWETGERRMHPAFWELLMLKSNPPACQK